MKEKKTAPPECARIVAWVVMREKSNFIRERRMKIIQRDNKYVCYISTKRVCAFDDWIHAVQWLRAAIHRHVTYGYTLYRFVPWETCAEPIQYVFAGCDVCPWLAECCAHEKVGF